MTPVEFLAECLAEWIFRSSILIAAGALLLWLLRVKDSSVRALAWTAILCGSFVIPILAIPALTSALPKTFLPTIRRTAAGVVARPAEVPVAVAEPTPVPPPEPIVPASRYSEHAAKPDSPVTSPFDWVRAALMLYTATCGVMILRLVAGLLVGLRLLRRSRATGQVIGEIEIRESADIAAPLTLGILRPAIVLPADWRVWDSTKLEAVLAHELSHIRRRDPWAQLLSGVHRAVLWVSPLSWFLHQRIIQTAEEASDDAAVAAIHDRVSYAETLLHFMQRGVWNSGVVGVSMARHGSPEKRIRRVLNSSALSGGVTRRSVAAIVAVMSPLAYVIATAQTRPQFDIADVDVSAAAGRGVIPSMSGGRMMRPGMYRVQTATMLDLIKTAYGVDADKILGGPSWLELDRYDVFAKAPDSTSADAARLMLQALLADRFKLVLHKESRPLPGFALTVAKGGAPKLKRADGSGSSGCKTTFNEAEFRARRQALNQAGDNSIILLPYLNACQNMTMAAFAEGMRSMLGAQWYLDAGGVVDRTGLSGAWDFNFKYTSKPPSSSAASGIDGENISLFDAMEKQLGLKLEAAKIPTPFLVVDSMNRKPTENPPNAKAALPPPGVSTFFQALAA